jgi:hypothetical protein
MEWDEIMIDDMPPRQMLSSLTSLCDDSKEFAIAVVPPRGQEDDLETYIRCVIIDTRKRKRWIDKGPFRFYRQFPVTTIPQEVGEEYEREGRLAELALSGHPEEGGKVIGTLRLLAAADGTILRFSLKDALWHGEITDDEAAQFRKFVSMVKDYVKALRKKREHIKSCPAPTEDGAGSRERFNYVNRNEWTITVEDKSLGDLRLILENLARQLEEKCSPVMLVGPLMGQQGTTDWALYYVPEKTRQTKRIPDYSDRGLIRVKDIPDGGGLAISFKAGEFPPVSHLFRQTLDDLSVKLGVSTPLPTEKPTPGQYVFRKSGEVWEIVYEGKRIPPLKDIYGLNYIGHVLPHPHRQFDLEEVEMAAKKSHPDTAIKLYAEESLDGMSDGGVDYEILDSQAMSEYQKRLYELVEERKDAERSGDAERLQKIDEETEDIEKQLRAATGLGGRKRKFPSDRERARQRVQKAIKLAIDKIGEHDSALAEHLRSAIRTGRYYCSYTPDPSMRIEWEV